MKRFNIVAIAFLFSGFGLIITGIIFKYLNYPDFFKGLYSGPVCLIIALVFLFRAGNSEPSKLSVSSRLTFIIKHFVSILIILLFLSFIYVFSFIEVNHEARIFAIIFGLLFLVGIIWMLKNVCFIVKVQCDNECAFINDAIIVKLEEITVVKKVFPIFYRISTIDNRNFLFIPHYSELMNNFFSIPKSVLELKNRIEKSIS
ncbi:MAG TPA: hypothetical protein DCQ26_19170 [Marinilabiliales bacterium]|nr:MAG: hypothetical protein A2W95_09960 [Bacteroidetes bacterium GWA2_40_14]OFX64943.1 MAG: hypothetical protein A2W84_11630 [Bacteroidetes bacterium GWC2_40_13]OFX72501.1 MAG: hypothetical protein A2W96_05535 [Bacteroidetes bacterium GWD2_40_43]OFX90585.1 MAG: hypothetical protein A2W97_02305 [Bacteroidetes bacterium GWE2_40_63]OFY20937.1 MAG: hypothetical protein A2W88_17955 [Bacteroidetes bacterium GWF2_40_13]OFZ23644.1 MAG: hypothetical protein A2437_06275 [Bacteroidetes bacterium RIFOXYC